MKTQSQTYDKHQESSGFTDLPSNFTEKNDAGNKRNHHGNSYPSRVVALLAGLGTLVLAAVGVYFFMDKNGYSLRKARQGKHENFQGQVTFASIALHDVPEDCWMEIHGKVYDLTDYAPVHPGGPEYVTDYCGMEATRSFDMEHSTSLLSLIEKYNLGEAVTTLEGESTMESAPGDLSDSEDHTKDSEDSSDEDSEDSSDEELPFVPGPVATISTTTQAAPDNTASTTASPPEATTIPDGCPVQYFSTAAVGQHNSRDDCWYILYGNIWDFTSYVDTHPGGARRLFEHCGTDATVPYSEEKKHDQSLLEKKTPNLMIGKLGSKTEIRYEPC